MGSSDDKNGRLAELEALLAVERGKNAQLSEQVKRLVRTESELYAYQQNLDRQVTAFAKLFELGKRFTAVRAMGELLQLAANFCGTDLGYERCVVFIDEGGDGPFVAKAHTGYWEDGDIEHVSGLTIDKHDKTIASLSGGMDALVLAGDPHKDVCTAELARMANRLRMDEFAILPLGANPKEISGLLAVGNTRDQAEFMTRVKRDDDSFVRLGNLVSLVRAVVTSTKYYQELEEERRLLERRVVDRTRQLSEALGMINSAIRYASRIQKSRLPDMSILDSFASEHFVLWEPRDVVGGDFYWCKPWGRGLLLILGDCTGHGVSGAFVTLIAAAEIDRAHSETRPGDVSTLVRRIHHLVQTTLGQDVATGASDDGMELGACYIEPKMTELIFVGARFDLYLSNGEQVRQIRGVKSALGFRGIPRTETYAAHTIALGKGTRVYLTTDGLIDQVGDKIRHMFGRTRFRQLLSDLQRMPLAAQKDSIYQALIEYQGKEVRRDDIAVIGFSV
jgi:serine phosphatase RsbU (regulator of sigma subunit)